MSKVYASLLKVDSKANEQYRIRFTTMISSAVFKGVDFVRLRKTTDYIIVEPVLFESEIANDKLVRRVFWMYDHSACITLTGLVKNEGWISKSAFGKRYKVKRDKTGKIYICLKEVVTDDDGKGQKNSRTESRDRAAESAD